MDYDYTQIKAVRKEILGGLTSLLMAGSTLIPLQRAYADDASRVAEMVSKMTESYAKDKKTADSFKALSGAFKALGDTEDDEARRKEHEQVMNAIQNSQAQQNNVRQTQPNVTVNNVVANTPQEKTWENSPKFFAYLSYKDFDNNGLAGRDEYIGEGNTFYQNQQIDFLANMSGKLSGYELFDENGKSIIKLESPTEPRRQIHTFSPNPVIMKPGNYVAVWSMDGKVAGKTEVKILERIVASNNKLQEKTWENSPKFFAHTGYKDFNNNGLSDRDEFIGEGNVFYNDQTINFYGFTGEELVKYQIINENGKLLFEEEDKKITMAKGYTFRNPPAGNYVAVWSVDGKVVGKTEVKVLERKSEEKPVVAPANDYIKKNQSGEVIDWNKIYEACKKMEIEKNEKEKEDAKIRESFFGK